ncbi:YjiH family protein [Mesobacillus harenae]|uniref:YjiH family protein n=1 Tax=Mesobacillus harenae TaxID=2213203 RepID=UPI001580F2A2|nr:YjiH family protein [Mesobacillus harenae]
MSNDLNVQKEEMQSKNLGSYLKFIIPSLIGILLFMVPVLTEDGITIPIAFLSGLLNETFAEAIPALAVSIMVISLAGTLLATAVKPAFIEKSPFLSNLFNVSPGWLIVRAFGTLFAIITLYQVGPEMVFSEFTGGLLIYDLIPILLTTFLLAGFFLPFLLNFGLLELFGALLTKVMRPLFTLPGRSSMDCLASWMGDGTIGVLLTTKQYEEGYYTKREAAVIATTFSVVSITFTIVVMTYLNLEQFFGPFYLTIIVAGLAAALIMPRIPPLSRKADSAYENTEHKPEEAIPAGTSTFKWGVNNAVQKAEQNDNPLQFFKDGLKNVMEMWLAVIPVVMAIGTVALVVAENTPLFEYLGMPFIPILNLMQVPEATAASQTMLVGFADMFLPAVIGSGIESEMTRFIIGAVSVTQLVYMSEMGGLLLGSKLPLKIIDLVFIFLLRTIITLPIVVALAHIFF